MGLLDRWRRRLRAAAPATDASRRTFLANVTMGAALAPGFVLAGWQVMRFLVPRASRRSEEVLLTRLADFPPGTSRTFPDVLGNDVIAVHLRSGDVRAFSAVCTHLGCHVQWDPQANDILCPCHMGRFDTTGRVIEGPPPSPLPAYPVRIDGDNLYLTLPVKEDA